MRFSLFAAVLTACLMPARAEAACYVAFVHGKREGKPTVAQVNSYWNPDTTTNTYSFPYYASDIKNCTKLMVRWDSRKSFVEGSADVASQISSFITTNAIANKNLILIGHSMGGLVTRYILNNSGLSANFTKVVNATKYLITSQTPHLGSKGADAVAFEAGGGLYGDIIATLALLTQGRNAASDSMRRIEMEYASASGGWMNDVARSRKIYTIESYETGSLAGPTAGIGSQNTSNLDLAWGSLCYKPHAINLNSCSWTPGDGLVETKSARGYYYRNGTWDQTRLGGTGLPTNYWQDASAGALAACQIANFPGLFCKQWKTNTYISGARVRWLDYRGDHQQGAWDRWKSDVHNYVTSTSTQAYLASYIGSNGHTLAQ
jgi:hypothetical protein